MMITAYLSILICPRQKRPPNASIRLKEACLDRFRPQSLFRGQQILECHEPRRACAYYRDSHPCHLGTVSGLG